MTIPFATCLYFINPHTSLFLAARKTRKVGIGKIFGYGGKFEEEDENDPLACTAREVKKETSGHIIVDRSMLQPFVLIDFYRNKEPYRDDPTFRVLFYRSFQSVLLPPSTEEMKDPCFYSIFNPPWKEMMPGDISFLPNLFSAVHTTGYIQFDQDESRVIQKGIHVRTKLEFQQECSKKGLIL